MPKRILIENQNAGFGIPFESAKNTRPGLSTAVFVLCKYGYGRFLFYVKRFRSKYSLIKVVLAVSTGRSLDDGGSQRSSRGRRSRVRAAHATCAACLRALPARLCRCGKVKWWQAVRCSAAAARGQRCLEAARSRRVLHCTLEPPWLFLLRVGLGRRLSRQTHCWVPPCSQILICASFQIRIS